MTSETTKQLSLKEAAQLLVDEYEPQENLADRSWWQQLHCKSILQLARHYLADVEEGKEGAP